MAKQALRRGDNLQHNVATLMARAQQSLMDLARVYFLTEVAPARPGRPSRPSGAISGGFSRSMTRSMATIVRTSGTAR